MKRAIILTTIIFPALLNAQVKFDDYFVDKTLRFDFMLAGNSEKTIAYPVGMSEEPYYGGSLKNLVDPFNYGNLRYEVYHIETGQLIYSRGYGSLFQEWQTTPEAKRIEKSFYEVATFPYPLDPVLFVLKKFNRDGTYSKVYETEIDPEDYFILKEAQIGTGFSKIVDSGNHHNCLDLVFIAEGYTENELDKFRGDVKRLSDILFTYKPFDKYRKKINIWAIEAVSDESGTDIPGEGIYKKTALNSSFYTFDLERYLTTFDIKSVRDYAGIVPYDNIIVLINTDRYGGGGMYNYYSGTSSDNLLTPQVFTHELGHGLAGLGDEYYSSTVAYEEFYPLSVEPWEANLTTLVDFNSKWKDKISSDTPTPTPATEDYSGIIGLFEGGGYSGIGIFRPQLDCRMKSNEAEAFCLVCAEALEQVIRFYTK